MGSIKMDISKEEIRVLPEEFKYHIQQMQARWGPSVEVFNFSRPITLLAHKNQPTEVIVRANDNVDYLINEIGVFSKRPVFLNRLCIGGRTYYSDFLSTDIGKRDCYYPKQILFEENQIMGFDIKTVHSRRLEPVIVVLKGILVQPEGRDCRALDYISIVVPNLSSINCEDDVEYMIGDILPRLKSNTLEEQLKEMELLEMADAL